MLLSARLRCDTSHRGDSALGCWCVLEGNSPNPGASTPLRKKIRQIPYVTFVNVERTSGPWPWCPLFFECLKISQTCITWKLSVSLQLWVWNNHHWERVKHGQSFECDKGWCTIRQRTVILVKLLLRVISFLSVSYTPESAETMRFTD